MIERHIKGGQKSIPYKQLGLSMDIETKVVQHVSSPKESNLTTLNLTHLFHLWKHCFPCYYLCCIFGRFGPYREVYRWPTSYHYVCIFHSEHVYHIMVIKICSAASSSWSLNSHWPTDKIKVSWMTALATVKGLCDPQ